MKLVLLGIALFISLNCVAQGTIPPRKNDLVVYQGTMVVDSTTQSQLFDRAAAYFTTYFSATKSFVYKVDKATGQIIIKPCISFPFKRDHTEYNGGLWHYTGTFTFKAGKYYYRLDNFYNTDFMFNTPNRMDLGPVECLYEDNNCNLGYTTGQRPDKIQSRMILKNIHKTMVAFMQDFDEAIRKK